MSGSDKKALDEVKALFTDAFEEYIEARKALDRAAIKMKRIRSLIALRPIYDAIMDEDNSDIYFETEQMLSSMDSGSLTLRTFIAEVENKNSKKATKNPVLDPELDPRYH